VILSSQFFRFCIIGALGYAVDVGVLYGLNALGLDLYSARLFSFLTAATATWLGNRQFTFSSTGKSSKKEWLQYVSAMGLGGLANYLAYAGLISYLAIMHENPWLAVAVGTAAGLVLNFIMARKLLHTESKPIKG
jgi:putative flippase GtrA